jgi:hypothetical protein
VEATILLNKVDGYRRRKGNNNPKPKFACPWPGCIRFVVCIADHVRRFHKVSVRTLGKYEHQRLDVSKGVTDKVTSVLSFAKGVADNVLISDFPVAQISTESPVQTLSVPCEVPLNVGSETAALPAEICQGAVASQGVPPNFTTILSSFKEYMSSIEAGRKARPEMYVLGARHVMESVGMEFARLTKLCVRKHFYEPLQDKIKSKEGFKFSVKTVRNKLKFLEYFCSYLLSDCCTEWVLESWASEIRKLREALPGWRQSLRGPCTAEELNRRVLDGQEPVTRDDIAKYRESQYSIVATQILHDRCMQLGSTSAPAEFIQCRNHLLVLLSITNAHRSGVMCNFTTTDYDQGLRAPRTADGSICFTILNHKTATTHGTANLAVDAEEAVMLASYMSMRNNLSALNIAPFVFINSTGTQMSASNIGSALTRAFVKSGYNERVTCSKLRKTAVTEIHTNFPNKKGDAADHMCHREATASKYYKMISKQNNSVLTVNLLRQALKENKPSGEGSKPEEPCIKSIAKGDDTTDDCDTTDESYKPDSDDTESIDDFRQDIYTARSRGTWSIENASLVKLHFEDLIEKHSAPMYDINLRLEKLHDLRKKLEHDLKKSGYALTRAVRDKVRTYYRHIYGFQKSAKATKLYK